jgi:large subunit ribosomal protein L27e
MPMRL